MHIPVVYLERGQVGFAPPPLGDGPTPSWYTPDKWKLYNMHFQILKMTATSGFLTALECTNFVFGQGSAPDPAGGAYSASPDPLAGLRGTLR